MLTHWSRFADLPTELNRLRDEMERAFGSGVRGIPRRTPLVSFPALNLWEDNDNLFVEAELPGIEMIDLEIFVNGGDQLTLQGERKLPMVEKGMWHRKERGFGKFSRIVVLPDAVDANQVTAQLGAGVLKITLPKKEEAKPRRIEVRSN